MSAPTARAAPLLLAALAAALPGCVWYGAHSMTRAWADRNTLDRPALFVERLTHAPPPRERVERFRWMYGVGPGMPFVAPEPMVFAPPEMALPPLPPPQSAPDGCIPPPAPVPDPPAPAVEAPRPRSNVAWLFAPSRG